MCVVARVAIGFRAGYHPVELNKYTEQKYTTGEYKTEEYINVNTLLKIHY